MSSMDVDSGIDFRNLQSESVDLSSAENVPTEQARVVLSSIERKNRAKEIIVPTDDATVKARLRELGHPIILFGEGAADRRDRLRYVLLDAGISGLSTGNRAPRDTDQEEEEEFYTPGGRDLLQMRKWLAHYSLKRTAERIGQEQELAKIPFSKVISSRKAINKDLQEYVSMGSQVAAERPVSMVRFSPNNAYVAAGSWGGQLKLFSVPNMEEEALYRGHTDRIGGVCWHPQATLGLDKSAVHLISGAADGLVNLWNMEQKTPFASLAGHDGRVCRTEFHPTGRIVGSAGFDTTFRLWDVEKQTEMLMQEGHSREVFAIAFQGDGSICASGGLDAIGRVWDIRTGRTIMVLDGHIRDITGLDFRGGHQIASASQDNSVKIWDLRMVRCQYTIAAHKNVVSDVRFYKGPETAETLPKKGSYFVSSGFDGKVNIWSSDDWALQKSLAGHEAKVMSADISLDGKYIVSSGYDRTIKLWANESVQF